MIPRTVLSFIALLTALAATSGCAKQGALVRLTPATNNLRGHTVSQYFPGAYAAIGATGEMDIALLTNAEKTQGGLRQVMHLRILWKPMRGTKTDQPSTTNAVLDWGIFDSDGGPDQLRYSGAGFVLAYRSGDALNVTIRNATMRLVGRSGQIDDPIGPATLAGKFTARIDPARVEAALAALNANGRAAAGGHTH